MYILNFYDVAETKGMWAGIRYGCRGAVPTETKHTCSQLTMGICVASVVQKFL